MVRRLLADMPSVRAKSSLIRFERDIPSTALILVKEERPITNRPVLVDRPTFFECVALLMFILYHQNACLHTLCPALPSKRIERQSMWNSSDC